MVPLQWCEEPQQHESLVVALRAVLAGRGVEVAYEELLAALGLTTLVVAVPDQPDPGRWAYWGRDVLLVEAARGYGLRLRELHPPEAASGLDASREFADHFRDSYAPLIRRALAHDQPVLAWRGWHGECAERWGVITGEAGDGFEGRVAGAGERAVRLSGPAVQVYVVEALEQNGLVFRDPAVLLARAAGRAKRLWDNQIPADLPYVAGAAAYERWLERLAFSSGDAAAAGSVLRRQRILVRNMAAARDGLARWLSALGATAWPDDPQRARRCAAQALRVRDELRLLAAVDPERATADGRAYEFFVLEAVRRIRSADEQLIARLAERA